MKQLIKDLVSSGCLTTPRIIDAFQKVDRKDFVTDEYKDEAYINAALPIGYGQTISQPLTVAFMLELLQPEPDDKVLDVGSGSGWQTALLCHIIGEKGRVFGIELIPELSSWSRKNIAKYNFIQKGIAKFICEDASNGLSEEAPFDRIIAAASTREIPQSWKEQLKIGGRLVVPVEDAIWLLIKKSEGNFEEKEHKGFVFVPFVS